MEEKEIYVKWTIKNVKMAQHVLLFNYLEVKVHKQQRISNATQ